MAATAVAEDTPVVFSIKISENSDDVALETE
jgi:hypothetical protein